MLYEWAMTDSEG